MIRVINIVVIFFIGLPFANGQTSKYNLEWSALHQGGKGDRGMEVDNAAQPYIKTSAGKPILHAVSNFDVTLGEGKERRTMTVYKVTIERNSANMEVTINFHEKQWTCKSTNASGEVLKNEKHKFEEGLITDYKQMWEKWRSHYKLYTAAEDREGNIYLVSQFFQLVSADFSITNTFSNTKTDYAQYIKVSGDFLVMKLSSNGSLLWAKKLESQLSSNAKKEPSKIKQDEFYYWHLNDKGLYLVYNTLGQLKEKEEKTGKGEQTDITFFDSKNGAMQTQTLFTRKGEEETWWFIPKYSRYAGENSMVLYRENGGNDYQLGKLEIN